MSKTCPTSLRTSRPNVAGAAALGAAALAGLVPMSAHAAATDGVGEADIVITGKAEKDANPNADPIAPYKIDRSDLGKLTEPIRDTPKSITVIPKEVIEDVGATTFREVARTTPGVTLGTGEGGNAFGDRIFIRGFEARNDIYIDGMRDPGVTSREVFAIEQIEIIKGPSSNFGGRGTTGGLVSIQSKTPLPDDFVIAEGGIGTDNYYRATLDANYNLTDSFGIRVNGLYHEQDIPGRDEVFSDRYGAAAAMFWNPAPGVTVEADYHHFELDGMSDYGHPFDPTRGKPADVDRNNFYGAVGRDFLENGSDIGTVKLTYREGGNLAASTQFRLGETYNRYVVSVPRAPRVVSDDPTENADDLAAGFSPGDVVVNTGSPQRNATNQYFANITDLTVRFDTGGIDHALVVGTEYASEEISNRRYAFPELVEDENGDRIDTPSGFIRDLYDPDPVLGFDIPVLLDETRAPTMTDVKSMSAFAIDTIDLTDSLKATLGVRYDTFDIESSGEGRGGVFARSADVDFWNYQASLLWKPVEAASIYASFATSSNPSGEQLDSTSTSYGGLGAGEEDLSPERNTSYEIGAKVEINPHLLLTAAVFQIDKTNAREQTAPGVFELTGELRSRGIELGIQGNVTPQLSVYGGYTYLDAAVTESVSDPANVGLRFANVPEHSASLLAAWKPVERFEIGGQVTYRSEIFGGSLVPNAGVIDGFVRLDAFARFDITEYVQLRLNGMNLTDEVYYDAIYRSGSPFAYIAPGRSGYATLAVQF